jgi:hypothetical protein
MEPLVPNDVDLRGMPFMPLDVNRLRDSQLSISATGDEFRAAVLLWCASWNQVPAASLPDDELSLAAYAGYARDVKGWRKVRKGALRGFVMCSDGRWYHPVVADKALEAWAERQEYREGKENEKDRKTRERQWRKRAFEALRAIGIVPEWNVKTSVLRTMVQDHDLPIDMRDSSVTGHAHVTVTGHGPDTAKTGTGTGTGTGKANSIGNSSPSEETEEGEGVPPLAVDRDVLIAMAKALRDLGMNDVSPSRVELLQLVAAGATVEQAVDTALELQRRPKANRQVPKLNYLAATLMGRAADFNLSQGNFDAAGQTGRGDAGGRQAPKNESVAARSERKRREADARDEELERERESADAHAG